MENLITTGRDGDPRLGELTEFISQGSEIPITANKETLVITGCPDDTGVTRNRGRAGASGGPDGIRKHFFKMTPPMDVEWEKRIAFADCGNIVVAGDIVDTHARAFEAARWIGASGGLLVALGGGHDFAAPNFLGFVDGNKQRGKKALRWGLINVDPHLDVRELEDDKPHSGTPFRQILESGELKGVDFVQFGTRRNRNSRGHFAYCRFKKVTVDCYGDLRAAKKSFLQSFQAHLKTLSTKCDAIGLTIDLDSCADAEGTSAAPVIGFAAYDLMEFAYLAGTNPKVRYLEMAEAAPALDPNERICRIAAEILFAFALGKAAAKVSKR